MKNVIQHTKFIAAFACATLLLSAQPGVASATPITFSGSSGNLSAEATFSVSGSNLLVTLTNTSLADVLIPADVLTGVFFDLTGNPTLGRVSAILSTGSSVLFGTTDPGGVVGGEWAYKNGLVGAPYGAKQGIESSGLIWFGKADRFPGNNLQGNLAPGGLEYGITSAGDNPLNGNAAVTGGNALIKNSVDFVLSGLGIGFDPLFDVSNVSFQYGTNLAEPNIPGNPPITILETGGGLFTVPEPASLALIGLGFAGLMISRRKSAHMFV